MDFLDLARFVGMDPMRLTPDSDDYNYMNECWTRAIVMITHYIGAVDSWIPDDVIDYACLLVGAELWYARGTNNGAAQQYDTEAPLSFRPKDPMTPAYPVLARFVMPF